MPLRGVGLFVNSVQDGAMRMSRCHCWAGRGFNIRQLVLEELGLPELGDNLQYVFQRSCCFHMSVQELQIPSEEVLFLLMMKISFRQGSTSAFVQSLGIVHDFMKEGRKLPACVLPMKILLRTKASLNRPHHAYSGCRIKIRKRDPGSLTILLVRPLRCRRPVTQGL